MLDQVSLSNSISLGVRQQRSDQLQLVIARKYLLVALFMCFFILIANDLHIIFNDIGEIIFAKDFFPEIICLHAVRIWWIACTIVVTFVERQEPRLLPLELGAHPHFIVIYSKVNDTPLKAKKHFIRSAFIFILLYSIRCILLRKLIFQLHGNDGQTIQKQAYIQCQQWILAGILELPGHTENILCVEFGGSFIAGRRTHIKHIQYQVLITEPLAQQVDHTIGMETLIQPLQEFFLFQRVVFQTQLLHFVRLRGIQKTEQPCFIHRDFFIVIRIGALLIAVVLHKPAHNRRFKAVFFYISRHPSPPPVLPEPPLQYLLPAYTPALQRCARPSAR